MDLFLSQDRKSNKIPCSCRCRLRFRSDVYSIPSSILW